jgi:hypothetical protein
VSGALFTLQECYEKLPLSEEENGSRCVVGWVRVQEWRVEVKWEQELLMNGIDVVVGMKIRGGAGVVIRLWGLEFGLVLEVVQEVCSHRVSTSSGFQVFRECLVPILKWSRPPHYVKVKSKSIRGGEGLSFNNLFSTFTIALDADTEIPSISVNAVFVPVSCRGWTFRIHLKTQIDLAPIIRHGLKYIFWTW